jgi:benzaldehyde dehydrogenase (NAD)
MATTKLAHQQLLIGDSWTEANSGNTYEQAFLFTGGSDGPCFPPTVLAGVTPEMRVCSEESFGPLLAVVSVDGRDEAVRVADDTEYGLSAAVFSENVAATLELAQRADR